MKMVNKTNNNKGILNYLFTTLLAHVPLSWNVIGFFPNLLFILIFFLLLLFSIYLTKGICKKNRQKSRQIMLMCHILQENRQRSRRRIHSPQEGYCYLLQMKEVYWLLYIFIIKNTISLCFFFSI